MTIINNNTLVHKVKVHDFYTYNIIIIVQKKINECIHEVPPRFLVLLSELHHEDHFYKHSIKECDGSVTQQLDMG